MKKWYHEPFFDSTSWIFENLMHLNLTPEEALTVLMINYLNSKQIRITNDVLSKRTGLTYEKLDQVIALLCAKNYLDIKATANTVTFQLNGLFERFCFVYTPKPERLQARPDFFYILNVFIIGMMTSE